MQNTAELLPVRLSDGTQIRILAAAQPPSSPAMRGAPREGEIGIFDRAISFEQIAKPLGSLAKDLGSALRAVSPSRLAIEFGVDVQWESAGVLGLIIQAGGTASLKITLEWENLGK